MPHLVRPVRTPSRYTVHRAELRPLVHRRERSQGLSAPAHHLSRWPCEAILQGYPSETYPSASIRAHSARGFSSAMPLYGGLTVGDV